MFHFVCLLALSYAPALSLDCQPTLPVSGCLSGSLEKIVNKREIMEKKMGTLDKVKDLLTGAADKVTSEAKDTITCALGQFKAGTLDKLKETASKLGMEPTQACEEVKNIVDDFKRCKYSFSDLTFTCTTPSGKGSVKLQFVPEKMEIEYSITIEGKEIGSRSSANHPPAKCLPVFKIPLLKFCIDVFDLSFARTNLQANICSQVEVRIDSMIAASVNLNCVEIQPDPLKVRWQCAQNAPGGGFLSFDMSKVIPCNSHPSAVRALTQF